MKLEKEIHQKKFRNQHNKLIVNLIYSYNWLIPQLRGILSQYDVTLQQYNILRILRGQRPRPATIAVLRERMLDKQSDVSRLIDRLISKSLAERARCSKDRRKMDVVITQTGLNMLERIDHKIEEFDSMLSNLTCEEATALNDLLDKMRG